MQEEGLTNEGRHHLLLLSKQAHDKRGIAESLHAQITRPRLTACEVGVHVFSREISQLSKICPPPSFMSHLGSSPMGVFLRDYGSRTTTCTIDWEIFALKIFLPKMREELKCIYMLHCGTVE